MYLSPESLKINASPTPWQIKVYDGTFAFKGAIQSVESLTITARHNAVGSAVFTLRSDAIRSGDLFAPGARCVVELNGDFFMSGPVVTVEGSNEAPNRTLTFTIEDDFRILSQILGWPNPAGNIDQQGAVDVSDKRSGPAETVLKGYVTANIGRLGLPLTVAPNLGRGDGIDIAMRMNPLYDKLFPAVDQAGIGVTVRQKTREEAISTGAPGLILDCYEPTIRTRPLTDAPGGPLKSWSFTRTAPTATTVIVGGSGEGTAREFRRVRDTALEAAWHMRAEVFRDARDTDIDAEMDARGAETLAEGKPTTGFNIELAETATFRYGRTLNVGDIVTINVAPNAPIQEVIREVVISHTTEGGLTVKPTVADGPPEAIGVIARAAARLAVKVRKLEASR